MRILLHDQNTNMYYVHSDQWVSNPDEAHDFHSGDLTVDTAAKLRLLKAETVYQFKDTTLNFSIPIPDFFTKQ